MFSNLINSRKGSGDRSNHRLSGSSQPVTAERIRHPQHVYAQDGPGSPSYESSSHGSSYMTRQDSAGSTSASGWNSPGAGQVSRSPAQLPEEMRAREKQRQVERERERRERQSSQSSVNAPSPAPAAASSIAQDSPAKYSSSHMESSVTRLLVATKMLLESLTKWSIGQRSEEDVSDIYVRLGNDFNSAKLAFGSYGIDMSDLNSVPDDLRDCLERCLSEEASPAVLEVHLPRIREIIINLLQGLKMKQAEYKQFLVQQRAAKEARRSSILPEAPMASTPPPPQQPPQTSSRVLGPRASRQGFSEGNAPASTETPSTAASTASQRPDPLHRASSAGAALHSDRTSLQTAGDEADPSRTPPINAAATRGSVTRPPSRISRATSDRSTGKRGSEQHSPALPHATFSSSDASETESGQVTPRMPSVERHTLVDDGATPAPVAPSGEAASSQEELLADQPGPLTGMPPQRLSTRSPRHTPKSSVDTADFTEHDPSLRALKNRDALERRASKRFSAYTFNKMGIGQSYSQGLAMNMYPSGASGTGSPLAERKPAERRTSGARRVIRPPLPEASPALEGASSPSTLARTTDYFGSSSSSNSISSGRPLPRSKSSATIDSKFESIEEVKTPTSSTFSRDDGRTPSPEPSSMAAGKPTSAATAKVASAESKDLLAPVAPAQRVTSQAVSSTESLPFVDAPPAPSEVGDAAEAQSGELKSTASVSGVAAATTSQQVPATPRARSSTVATSLNVFLQLGRQTRKAVIELDTSNPVTRGISVARLRMLFIDRFAYSPGMDDFPTIYVKDPASGVTYELEDLGDVQEGSLLTLNIEPLDQVKQHLDLSLGTISRELRELKAALAERDRDARRISFVNNDSLLAAHATPTKISDSQFQAAGQRVAQLKRANTRAAGAQHEQSSPMPPQDTGLSGLPATSSSSSALAGSRIAHELKVQFEELQNLRREFAVTRQLQADFEGDVKSILDKVREQSGAVRAIASTKVAAERNFIVAGKARLDTQSQDLLTLIEDLQDTVDDLRVDVIQRGVKPRPVLVKQIVEDVDRATKGLLELEGYVQTVKPSWKKTWESELQNIVDEQEFLNHEEGLLSDLRDDLGALKEVFSNIQQVVKLRGGSGKGGKYIPPLPEEGHEGLSTVMMEVKSQAVNHEKRLRALQAVERQRQKDLLASKTNDEFSEELAGFVDKKVLRKTGGVLEAERVRQKRDHATWKAMFGGGGPGGVPMAPSGSGAGEAKPKKLILGSKKKEEAVAPSASLSTTAANISTSAADDDALL